LEVLAALEKWGQMGLGQLDGLLFRKEVSSQERVRLFFNEIGRKDYWGGAYKRLRKLELDGLIKARSYINERKIFFLTERGHKALRARGKAAMRHFRRNLSRNWLRHELTVTAVGLMISELGKMEVTTERERFELSRLESRAERADFASHTPDLWVAEGGFAKAIEVELEPKSKQRYKKLWMDYRVVLPRTCQVLYVACWPTGRDWLLRLAAKSMDYSFVWAASLADFRKTLGRSPFLRLKGSNVYELRIEKSEALP
jgi:DNA-binding PadR family transcriptional regulator